MSETTATEQLRAALTAGSYEHRALTVVHRWYSGYETEGKNLAHHGELITDDFTLNRPPESGLPSVTGRQPYLDGLATAYPGQTNAHHLRNIEIERTGQNTTQAVVTHDFETRGPNLNGSALLRYDFELLQDPAERLPRITTFAEQVLSYHEAPLREAYGENRVLSFVHYWLSLLEQPADTAEPLRELIADDLAMTLSDGRVLHTFDEVAAWYADTGKLVDISTHHISDLTITPGPGHSYRVTMDFDWEGINRSGQPMTARTRHDWTLTDTDGRYLRLSRFAVTTLNAFTPVTATEALHHFEAAKTR
ncbi:hypothetical protein [Streptomyces avermitilis]|uniref:hypothetical protein n=1 Tax=Streptomyces avermitilis TaxID=33903 RepID=UPI00380BDE3F